MCQPEAAFNSSVTRSAARHRARFLGRNEPLLGPYVCLLRRRGRWVYMSEGSLHLICFLLQVAFLKCVLFNL